MTARQAEAGQRSAANCLRSHEQVYQREASAVTWQLLRSGARLSVIRAARRAMPSWRWLLQARLEMAEADALAAGIPEWNRHDAEENAADARHWANAERGDEY